MRRDTADKYAAGYAGAHDGFSINWERSGAWIEPDRRGVLINNVAGWYIAVTGDRYGPYETSQAAFCAAKTCIDKLIDETG